MLRPVHIGPDPYSEIDLDDWSSPERTAHLERNVYLTAGQVAEAELLAAVAKDMNSKANQMPKRLMHGDSTEKLDEENLPPLPPSVFTEDVD